MEKETVDYAMAKLNDVFQSIKPDAMELGSEYVQYAVMKQTIEAFIFMVVLGIGAMLALITYKCWDGLDFDEYFTHLVLVIITGIMCILGVAGSIIEGYQAVLANQFPLRWTIEQLSRGV